MRISYLGLFVLCLCPWPCAADDAADVAKLVQDAHRAGFEKHDLAGYLAIWSADAKRIEGRGEKPDKYDTALTRAQLEATRKLLFAVTPPKGVKLEIANVRTAVQGDMATVHYRATLRQPQPRRALTTDEVFQLRRKDGKWTVYENRSWPIELMGSDYILTYEPSTWEAYDARVARAGTLGEKLAALIDGLRRAEAHAAAKAWTEEAGKFANAWVTRGLAAMAVADVADATASFKKALALDPEANLPDYAKAAALAK